MVETQTDILSTEESRPDFPIISSGDLYDYLRHFRQPIFENDHVWERSLQTFRCTQMPSVGFTILGEESNHIDTHTDKEQKARFSLQSLAGREITLLFTDIVRDHLMHDPTKLLKPIKSITTSRVNLDDQEKEIYDSALKKIAGGKKFVLNDLAEVTFNLWKNIKSHYAFVDQQIDRDLLAWNFHLSPEQLAVEEAVIGIHSLKIKQFLEQDLFGPQKVFLPLETNPTYDLESKSPYRYQIYYKGFGIQHVGSSDWVLNFKHGIQNLKIVVQQKYVPSQDNHSIENRLKVLIHSLGVNGYLGKNWANSTLNPAGVVYLQQHYDYQNASCYYVDLSITPQEFPFLLDTLQEYSRHWVDNNVIYKGEVRRRKKEVVLPKLQIPAGV